jgi:hypothetical protein
MDRDKMSNLYKGPSIDASYQVSVHLAEGFKRRRLKCEKLTDNGHQVMAKAHVAFGKSVCIYSYNELTRISTIEWKSRECYQNSKEIDD